MSSRAWKHHSAYATMKILTLLDYTFYRRASVLNKHKLWTFVLNTHMLWTKSGTLFFDSLSLSCSCPLYKDITCECHELPYPTFVRQSDEERSQKDTLQCRHTHLLPKLSSRCMLSPLHYLSTAPLLYTQHTHTQFSGFVTLISEKSQKRTVHRQPSFAPPYLLCIAP